MPAIPTTLLPCRDGDYLLITTSGQVWAKGATIMEAKRNLSKAGGYDDKFWHVYSVDPSARVDEVGWMLGKKDHPFLLIAAYNPPAADVKEDTPWNSATKTKPKKIKPSSPTTS